jgi:hypothetical protein
MNLLEPTEIQRRSADGLVASLAADKSIKKFDDILRADRVTPGTRAIYLWQLSRIKKLLPAYIKCDLADLPDHELIAVLGKIADRSKETGYITTTLTVIRFQFPPILTIGCIQAEPNLKRRLA